MGCSSCSLEIWINRRAGKTEEMEGRLCTWLPNINKGLALERFVSLHCTVRWGLCSSGTLNWNLVKIFKSILSSFGRMIFGFYTILFILLHYYVAICLQFPNKKYPKLKTFWNLGRVAETKVGNLGFNFSELIFSAGTMEILLISEVLWKTPLWIFRMFTHLMTLWNSKTLFTFLKLNISSLENKTKWEIKEP